MNFTRQAVSDMCRSFGQSVSPIPQSINPAALLWSLTGNESTFGLNCTPRYEPAFDAGGDYGADPLQVKLRGLYGKAAACSYGPFQIMLVNAARFNENGAAPEDFTDLYRAFALTLKYLDNRLAHWKPQSVADVGQIWNSGHIAVQPSPGVQRYMTQLEANYKVPLLPVGGG